MTSRKTNSSRKLSFQTLEDRQLMAGNVTAAMSNGSLNITGDAVGDDIQITAVAGKTNQFTVTGINGTKVNNKASQNFTVTGNISVVFKGGNDNLDVGVNNGSYNAINLPGSLNVVLGDGNNGFSLEGATVAGNLTVTGGNPPVNSGNSTNLGDFILIGMSSIGKGGGHDARITLGKSDSNIQTYNTVVERDLLLSVNGNNNYGYLEFTRIGRDLTYTSALDADQVEFDLFAGRVGRNATIKTGDSTDKVDIAEEYIDKVLDIETGWGQDTVWLGEADINGSGTPVAQAQFGVHAANINVNLGDSDDTLRVAYISGVTNFNGGDGFGDQLFHDDGQNVGSTYGTTGFEYVEGNLVPPPTHKHTASTGSTLKMKL